MTTTRRRYTRKQKVTAVTLALVSNAEAASEKTGVPRTNIRRWMDDPELAEYGLKTREEIANEARALGVEHYRALIASDAFYRAGDFDEFASALERALENPSELQAERQRVSKEVVGEIDGRAAERVVAAIRDTLARSRAPARA